MIRAPSALSILASGSLRDRAWRRGSTAAAASIGLSSLFGACAIDDRQVNASLVTNLPAGAGGSASLASDAGADDARGSKLAGDAGGSLPGNDNPRNGVPEERVPPVRTVATEPGCGDGVWTADEACDDANRVSGDGCSADCLDVEVGFSCAGTRCMPIARCGDGLVATTEQCDDGNLAPADGCSDHCRVELGKKCAGEPSVCSDALCGNSVQEGAESCDDGNTQPFDGCSQRCQKEPSCLGTACLSSCGDGLLINEECDDGNLTDGDGCSSTCQREVGATCASQFALCEQIGGQCVLRVPALFRDFADTHPDFGNQACNATVPGAVGNSLDVNGRPVLGAAQAVTQACLSSAANFADWYTNNARNAALAGELLLFDDGTGGYVNRFGARGEQFQAFNAVEQRIASFDGTPLFFPVDSIRGPTAQSQPASIGQQYGPAMVTPEATLFPGAPNHNFSFTSEMQVRFAYRSDTPLRLTVGTEDDIWVFLNGRLALELGGVHELQLGKVEVDPLLGQVTVFVSASLGGVTGLVPAGRISTSAFGLMEGNVHTLSIFQAERKPPLSSLLLQLQGFAPQPSSCVGNCGDGLLGPGEECDDGRNVGGYGACRVGCLLGPFCGDGITQPEFGETCDVGPHADAICRGCRVRQAR